MRSALLITIIFSLIGSARGNDLAPETATWIAEQAEVMQGIASTNLPAGVQTDAEGNPDFADLPSLYSVSGNVGRAFFQFSTNQWVFIALHSSHLDDGVGDVILAKDESGNFWINDDHVCGGVRFWSPTQQTPVTKSREFLREYVSRTKNRRWKLMKEIPQQPAEELSPDAARQAKP